MSYKLRFFLAIIFLPGLFSSLSAQENVNYTIIDNEARMPKLRVGLELLHLDGMFGQPDNITAGVGIYGGINLGKRIGFSGNYYLPLYKSGRTAFQAGGFLAFKSKVVEKTTEITLKRNGITRTYVSVPIQALKQNRLRYGLAVVSTDQLGNVIDEAAGINETDVRYRTRSQMFFAGISRFWGTYAKINAEGYGEKKGGINYSIGLDVLFQGVTLDGKAEIDGQDFEVTRAGEYSPLGFRFVMEVEAPAGLFPLGMYVRTGWRPGFLEEENGFLEWGVVVPLIMTK